ncbi:acetyl-CoA carboxylase, carboxyltransferase subunit beta [Carboxydochorda subterranea]|uniref:Acetyl-coenzyme A carboxylase carboxyl transferase subunit beta n=1 Tax=Carboxydichorda subterranea TaxID=3109565 RepID=A0ABZ1BUV6_9FIRM|nr:acetyl-CoA carboxylase, carboxyltransferase subunit beta [Limnochorda sp. L945t]WRP16306.1 acetyl-CoA carboxylase, carboxyltransferase subunit beta [Limnochorda sp. L945t]
MLKDLFRGKPRYVTVKPPATMPVKREAPDGLWTKCSGCGAILYSKELVKHFRVCPRCGYHFRIGAWERLRQVLDAPEQFVPFDRDIRSVNPLGFPGYEEKLTRSRQATGLDEAAVLGQGTIGEWPAVVGAIDFGFMGGSMGSVVGERIARGFERAVQLGLPVVLFSAGGGGARMHEGILSLMQMVKTSQAVAQHSEAGLLYISVLTDPTMGGIYASFASLADIIVAEPGALIGFAGPRVVEETIRQKLPPGFQSSEFALRNGMIDMIVDRRQMKPTLARLLALHAPRKERRHAQ